jgi:hypothetical protein
MNRLPGGLPSENDFERAVEVKKTRAALEDKPVGEQLMVDIQRYPAYQDCKRFVCFVHDPEGRIGNPAGLERDLSREADGLTVQVLVYPKFLQSKQERTPTSDSRCPFCFPC